MAIKTKRFTKKRLDARPPLVHMLTIGIHTREMPAVLSRFTAIVGSNHWLNRAKAINDETTGHPYLRDHLLEETE